MGTNIFRAFFIYCLFSLAKGNILVDEECLNYTVYPVQYELNIYPYVHDKLSYYECELIITIIANAPNVNVINLVATDLDIETGSIHVYDGSRDIINTENPFEYGISITNKLKIFLKEPLKMYHALSRPVYTVKITFRKFLKEDGAGVFLVKYYDSQSNDYKYLFTTRLSPNKAKYFFPCFENPRFEAVFKFKVYVLKHLKDLQYTNTSLVIAEEYRRDRVKGDYKIIEYMPSPQVGLHQVGFHYSRFASNRMQAKHKNDTLIVWAPYSELPDYKFIQNYGIAIINLMHEYSDANWALVQGPINLIAVPATFSGYEIGSWNLLTNGAYRLVNIDQFTSIKQIEFMTFELTQQLSRIWLGNPGEIERTRWKEEWFKEGMATYFAYYFMTQYNHGIQIPGKRRLAGYGIQMKHRAMAIDSHRTTPALESFNTSMAIDIPPRYKELVTMKTGAILWMLENWVGSEKFHKAMVRYITSRRGKYISLQDFTTTLDKDTIECLHQFFNGSTASRILDSWFRRRGYPVINVQVLRDRVPNAVQLKQRQFSFTQERRIDSDYLIPISYRVQKNENCFNCYQPRFTIGAQTYTFGENLNGGWIILNRKGSGYYRVNYDTVTWRLIAKTLKENMQVIDEINRAQIVNDVFALYAAGDLYIEVATEILDYLDKERNAVVWESVLSGFEMLRIEGASCNMTKHLYWEWENFLIRKISSVYEKLTGSKDRHTLTRLFRSNIVELACLLNYEPCHMHVRKMYVEDRRKLHNLFPDCRMAYFFVLANETFSNTYSRKLNPIEEDDKWIAEQKIREFTRFFGKIPLGEAKPMPIVMSTTEKIIDPVTEKLQTDRASSIEFLIMTPVVGILINIFMR